MHLVLPEDIIFRQLDIDFSVDIREVEEVYPEHLRGLIPIICDLKSKAFSDSKENDLIITSDTIVWFENKALGKPENIHDAFKMLKSMSEKSILCSLW